MLIFIGGLITGFLVGILIPRGALLVVLHDARQESKNNTKENK